jgi:hypothetical protein
VVEHQSQTDLIALICGVFICHYSSSSFLNNGDFDLNPKRENENEKEKKRQQQQESGYK